MSQHFDLFNARGVEQKCPLNADTMGCNAADGEGPVQAAPPQTDNYTLHHLDTFTVAFYNTNVNLYSVTRRKLRNLLFEVFDGPD
jgi:hypothetical protein